MPKVKHSIFSTHKLFIGFYDLIRTLECSVPKATDVYRPRVFLLLQDWDPHRLAIETLTMD